MTKVEKKRFSSGSAFEPAYGFSRVVRVGDLVFVSGTTSIQVDGTMEGGSDSYLQALATFRKISGFLEQAGASKEDIVRTRIFVKGIENYAGIERAHREFFAEILPAATLVEVTGFVRPEMLLEVEVDVVASG